MEGLLEEGKEIMSEEAEPEVMDAALIAAAQRVEHYEIAGYGCARTFARQLGHEEAANLLQQRSMRRLKPTRAHADRREHGEFASCTSSVNHRSVWAGAPNAGGALPVAGKPRLGVTVIAPGTRFTQPRGGLAMGLILLIVLILLLLGGLPAWPHSANGVMHRAACWDYS